MESHTKPNGGQPLMDKDIRFPISPALRAKLIGAAAYNSTPLPIATRALIEVALAQNDLDTLNQFIRNYNAFGNIYASPSAPLKATRKPRKKAV